MPFARPSITAVLRIAALASRADARADDAPAPSSPTAVAGATADAEITSDTAAQFYGSAAPSGQTIIAQRRLTTTLGVAVYDLLDRPSNGAPHVNGPTLTFRARLR